MSVSPGGCGCGNWWDTPSKSVCGEFETPLVEDQGQCSNRHTKIENGAPVLPVPQCSDDQYQTFYDPTNVDNPFYVIARLFDECCTQVTDEDGNAITLVLDQLGGYSAGTC